MGGLCSSQVGAGGRGEDGDSCPEPITVSSVSWPREGVACSRGDITGEDWGQGGWGDGGSGILPVPIPTSQWHQVLREVLGVSCRILQPLSQSIPVPQFPLIPLPPPSAAVAPLPSEPPQIHPTPFSKLPPTLSEPPNPPNSP